ncbi:MAG: SGNH/GDSL hydrolase family protein [Candidatus Lernaella stagnicola]|nr:SGNH/GDSL hydrolase family protein [Candidatus Lernaella stagnicola]
MLLGLVAAAALIELGLRLASVTITVTVRPPDNEVQTHFDDLIVCAGDSHTAGQGAPRGLGYPEQLEALLNESRGGRITRVINLGLGGQNSSEAADSVLAFLEHTPRAPVAIIFNAGKNNDHNLRRARIAPELVHEGDYRDWARYLLSESRAFRLSQITVRRLEGLAREERNTETLEYEDMLYVDGPGEIAMMRRWIEMDLDALAARTSCPVVLLNYWTPVSWVDETFAAAATRPRFHFCDARAFGTDFSLEFIATADITEKHLGGHPNERGYAVLAELVGKLLREEILPAAAPGI